MKTMKIEEKKTKMLAIRKGLTNKEALKHNYA
jgi:hypothetical protein